MRWSFRLAMLLAVAGPTIISCVQSPPLTSGYNYISTDTGSVNSSSTVSTASIEMNVERRDPNYSAGPNSKYNAVADFDGDGQLDVVVSNNVLNDLRIYSDPGQDFNTVPAVIPVVDGPRHVIALDLNGDRSVDLAVITDQNMVVLLNSGNGNFNTMQTYPLGGTGGYRVASADFNGDGYADLLAAGLNNTLVVLLNNGAGSFNITLPIPMTTTGRADASAGDVNGDGKADIVAVSGDPVSMLVYINQGNNTFASPVVYNYPTSGHVVPLFDIDGDGSLDTVVADEGSNLTVAFNDGHGGFTSHQLYTLASPWVDDVAFGDLNGDGLADLALSTWTGSDITVLPNAGHGKLGTAQHFTTPDSNWQVQVADFNGDGKRDLAVCAETYTLTLMINQTP